MNYLGVSYEMKHRPKLDPDFIPFGIWMNEYEKGATVPIAIAVERNGGFVSVRRAKIYNTAEMAAADYRFVERYMKFLLWSIGGFRVYVSAAARSPESCSGPIRRRASVPLTVTFSRSSTSGRWRSWTCLWTADPRPTRYPAPSAAI